MPRAVYPQARRERTRKQAQARWRIKNRERIAEYNRAYHAAHRAQLNEKKKATTAKNEAAEKARARYFQRAGTRDHEAARSLRRILSAAGLHSVTAWQLANPRFTCIEASGRIQRDDNRSAEEVIEEWEKARKEQQT